MIPDTDPPTTDAQASADTPAAPAVEAAAMAGEVPEPSLHVAALEPAAASAAVEAAEAAAAVAAVAPAGPAESIEPGTPADAAANEVSASQAAPKIPELSPAACGARLAALFPALFIGPHAPGPFKPIKLRIHADIQARAPGVFTKRTLGLFFSRYTTSTAYLKALANAPHRFDLDGQPAGEIASEHSAAAAEELARRRAMVLERQAAERKAQAALQPTPALTPAAPAADGETPTVRPARPARPPRPAPPARPPREGAAPDRRPEGAPDRSRREGPRDSLPGAPRNAPPRRAEPRRPATTPEGPPPDASQQTRQDLHRDDRAALRHDHAPLPPPELADPAQRERALLLRAFESSPLSKANFCVLKRLDEATLDVALELARKERGAQPAPPPRPERPSFPPRQDSRPPPRRRP